MWRSGMFWRLVSVSGGVLLLADCAQALILVSLPPPGADDGNQFRAQVLLTIGLTGLATLAITIWFTRRLVQPLYELAVGAKQVAAGDYGRKIFTDGQHEVGILARSFNSASERLAAQFAQLDEDRQQLRAVLSSMVEGVVATDAEQTILFANERAAQLLEFDSRTAVGRRLWEVMRHRTIQQVVQSALADGKGQRQELNWNGPAARSLAVHAGPLPGAPPRGVVLVLHDTTELRRLERLRQEFVANVSHELKTPLAIIKANVETLIDGAIDDVPHRGHFLQGIAEQSDHLNALILDLLSIARIEAGTETFVLQAVPVETAVQACLERRRPLLESKRQALELAPPASQLCVWADEEAVFQILDNLVDNAIKYTPEDGRLRIRWWGELDWVYIEVQDTGLGIPAQELPRIFERFYRVDKARSRALGGTGLGLSIVKHLVQAMRGGIEAVSTLNQGSTFTVRLPRRAA